MTKIQAVANMGFETYITKDFHAGTDTTMTVYDASQMPVAPSSVCINSLDNRHSIIISYTAINGNVVTVGSVIHSNGSDAETATYLKGCNVFKEFSDSVGDGSGGGGGTTNYAALVNKPKVNGVELLGDKNAATLGLVKNNWGTTEAGKVLKIGSDGYVTADTGGSGTSDYTSLTNKPKINNYELNNNVSLGDIGAFAKNWDTTTYEGYVVKIVSGIATPVPGSTTTTTFADIQGQPTDNTNLSAALAAKLNKSGYSGTTDLGKVPMIDSTGNLVMQKNVAAEVDWQNITGTISTNTALQAALDGKVNLSTTSAKVITGFGVDSSGNLYVDLP